MRKNILPHFLNHDARDILRFDTYAQAEAARTFLSDALRIAIMLSEAAAIVPPGHFLESDVAFDVIADHSILLNAGLVEMPMRELNLADLIEKKRSEYGSVRNSFPGLFDDARMRLFDRVQATFKQRKTRIGLQATQNWEQGPDVSSDWRDITSGFSPSSIAVLRRAPLYLLDSGEALTWPALLPHLNSELLASPTAPRLALQKNYFRLYLDEYQAAMLGQLPYGFDAYLNPDLDDDYYAYRGLLNVMIGLGLDWFPRTSLASLIQLKSSSGWIAFADSFVQMQHWSETPTNVVRAYSSIARELRVNGRAFSDLGRRGNRWGSGEARLIDELADALGAIAARISGDYGLLIRATRATALGISHSSRFLPHANSQTVRSSPPTDGVRTLKQIFIGTSNERELKAVREALLGFVSSEKAIRLDARSLAPRFSAVMPTSNGKVKIDIGLAHETGGVEAVDLLDRYLLSDRPDAVFYIGCSGLLNEKKAAQKNMVFVAKRAIDGDKRRLTDKGAVYDADQHRGDSHIRNVLSMMNATGAFDPIKVITNRDFISSSAFHESRTVEERRAFVEDFPPDAVVVEMEAYALYQKVSKLRDRQIDINLLVVKGISDFGDEAAQANKEQTQHRATLNAATVVLKMLKEIAG